jgi:endonuclease/exonuclease/phosphatase family metal-dependent hydrolase
VALLLEALAQVGSDLGHEGALPDVVAFQNLEADEPLALLRAKLEPSHDLISAVCARTFGGRSRSVLGVAVRRARFALRAHRTLELGALWPDHPRCALALRLRVHATGDELDVVNVHLFLPPGQRAAGPHPGGGAARPRAVGCAAGAAHR